MHNDKIFDVCKICGAAVNRNIFKSRYNRFNCLVLTEFVTWKD